MKLRCLEGPLRGEVIEVFESVALVLGREPQDESAQTKALPSRTVSKNHCRIEFDGKNFVATDLGSSNGTRLNKTKIQSKAMRTGDLLQVGEFIFVVEADQQERTPAVSVGKQTHENSSVAERRKLNLKERLEEARVRFEKLDFAKKVLITLAAGVLLAHFLSSFLILEDARKALFLESFSVGREVVKTLGDKNQKALAEKSALLLDCDFVRKTPGILEAYILDPQGKSLCPVSSNMQLDGLTQWAIDRSELVDDCESRILQRNLESCGFVSPVRFWNQERGQFETIGYSRIEFVPTSVQAALQNLQSTQWKSLILSLLLFTALSWIWWRWLRSSALNLAEGVHVAAAGNSQGLEKIENFSAFDPVIEEINRLLSKGSQGLSASSAKSLEEASFLQIFFQQVLLLEERAILVVDKENQFLAASASLAEAIPLNGVGEKAHITDLIADTHLQGELIGFLNDLSSGSEVLDRALSLSDRVVQVRGLPLFMNENYVAAFLVF